MEGCLKKLVLEAEAMGFWDPWKGGWEPMGASGTKTVPGGLDWKQSGVYSQPLEGQKTNSGLGLFAPSTQSRKEHLESRCEI